MNSSPSSGPNPATTSPPAFIRAADEEGRITQDELDALVIIMIIAGVGTTKMFITNAMLALLDHPDQLKTVVDDPSALAGSGIEELLRYESPVASVPWRFPTEDVRVGGQDIAAGEPVMVMVASANRDPDVFPDPHRLDLGRTGARHLGLGHGIHNCLRRRRGPADQRDGPGHADRTVPPACGWRSPGIRSAGTRSGR